MTRFKRVFLGACLAAVAAMAFAVPAGATTFKAECIVDGSADVTDKDHFFDKDDPRHSGVLLVGGEGFYSFTDTALVCAGTEKKSNPVVMEFDIESDGKYVSELCGRGMAWSTQTVAIGVNTVAGMPMKSDASYMAMIAGIDYKVVFAGAGAGQIHINNDSYLGLAVDDKQLPKPAGPPEDKDPREPGDPDANPPTGLFLAGEIQLGPPLPDEKDPTDLPNTEGGECTKSFHVDGVVHLNQPLT